MADPIRAALERLIELRSTDTHALLGLDWHEAFAAARAALAEQQGEGLSDEELNTLWNCSGIADEHGNHTGNIFEFARAVLAHWGHQPTPPAEGEVAQLVEWLRENAEDERQMCESSNRASLNLERAAELLQQRHPEPVPVSELPGPEDCDGEGRCWWGAPALFGTCTGDIPHSWRLCRPDDRFNSELVWLPATALPLPEVE